MTRYVSIILIRSAILIFWCSIIAFFLMLPRIKYSAQAEHSIALLAPTTLLDPHIIQEFEQQTGIKVYLNYYETGAELFSKIATTQGKGYDLIIPSDYTIAMLREHKLIKKFDRAKIPFIDEIQPDLFGHYYDPTNEYAIPCYWGVYILAIDPAFFKETPVASWGLIFNDAPAGLSLCMTDEPREALMMAALYLFGSARALDDPQDQQAIVRLLQQQKKRVQVYSTTRAEHLLPAKSCPIAVMMSPDFERINKQTLDLQMLVPREGSFLVVDAFVLSAATDKDDLIYTFLNYMFTPEVMKRQQELYGYCSVLKNAQQTTSTCLLKDTVRPLNFFRTALTPVRINDLWIEVIAKGE